ncbi:hypothetical protein GN956_G6834 [Arapaima gigas]
MRTVQLQRPFTFTQDEISVGSMQVNESSALTFQRLFTQDPLRCCGPDELNRESADQNCEAGHKRPGPPVTLCCGKATSLISLSKQQDPQQSDKHCSAALAPR